MFDLVGPPEVLLPFLGAAAALGAVGLGTRQGLRALSVDGRTARVRRQQLVRLRRLTGLRIAEDNRSLHGRVGGWMVEIHRAASSRSGLDAGAEPWRIHLLDGARPDAHDEPPAPPTGLTVVRREGTALVAMLPEASHVPAQLKWMTELAAAQHTRPRITDSADQALTVACSQLGLQWDDDLHQWKGTLAGRPMMLDRVHDQDEVQLHLHTLVPLPEGLWIGAKAFSPTAGAPLSIARHASLSNLTAIASTASRDAATELLDDRSLVAHLERCLNDTRGSRVAGNSVVLCRPMSLFSAAPRTVLEQALALAERLEHAVERPWLTLARTHGLTPSTERAGGRSILSGSRKGFRIEIRCQLAPVGVRIVAVPDTIELVRGLHIQAGPGGGRRTGNLILDQQLTIEAPAEVPDHQLANLPAEALMPLLVAHPTSWIHSDRIQIDLTGTLDIRALEHAIEDLDALLQALPRVATATSS